MPTLVVWILYRHPFGPGRLSGFLLIWIQHDLVGSDMIWWWNWLVHDTHSHIQSISFDLVTGCYLVFLEVWFLVSMRVSPAEILMKIFDELHKWCWCNFWWSFKMLFVIMFETLWIEIIVVACGPILGPGWSRLWTDFNAACGLDLLIHFRDVLCVG